MCRVRTIDVGDDPHAVATAGGRRPPSWTGGSSTDLRPDAELLVSELVTNAVLHSRGDVALTLAVADGMLEVGVTDPGPGLPPQRSPKGARQGRRGPPRAAAACAWSTGSPSSGAWRPSPTASRSGSGLDVGDGWPHRTACPCARRGPRAGPAGVRAVGGGHARPLGRRSRLTRASPRRIGLDPGKSATLLTIRQLKRFISPMPRRPTIADVARDAGVSKGAVSFALNDRPGVAPATRDRILRVAADLGWTPEPPGPGAGGRPRARGRPGHRPPARDPRRGPVLPGLHRRRRGRARRRRARRWSCRSSRTASARSSGYRRLAADGRVDGVFLTDLRVDDPRPALLERARPAGRRHRSVVRRPRRRARACASTTGRASPRRSSTCVELGPPPDRPRRRAGRVRARAGPARRLGRRARATPACARGRPWSPTSRPPAERRRRPRLLDLAGAADRRRLRQRPDGDRRHGRRRRPRPRRARATCRSPASTTPRSPPTCGRR